MLLGLQGSIWLRFYLPWACLLLCPSRLPTIPLLLQPEGLCRCDAVPSLCPSHFHCAFPNRGQAVAIPRAKSLHPSPAYFLTLARLHRDLMGSTDSRHWQLPRCQYLGLVPRRARAGRAQSRCNHMAQLHRSPNTLRARLVRGSWESLFC